VDQWHPYPTPIKRRLLAYSSLISETNNVKMDWRGQYAHAICDLNNQGVHMTATRYTGASITESRLHQQLVHWGHLTELQTTALIEQAQHQQTPFIDVLLQSRLMEAQQLAILCASHYGYPLCDLSAIDPAVIAMTLAHTPIHLQHYAIPLIARNNRLSVAISDPTNTQLLDQIKFQAHMPIDPVIVPHTSLVAWLEHRAVQANKDFFQKTEEGVVDANTQQTAPRINVEEDNSDDLPVVQFLQKMFLQAIQMGASDIHCEPFEQHYRIRFRIDGRLQEMAQAPHSIKDKVASRIKVLAKLDIAEKRLPQDGRLSFTTGHQAPVDFRVSTLPTLFGEKVVLRLLDNQQTQLDIDHLGYTPAQQACILDAIARPYGMILVTGPTGSGKTVSLYSYLHHLNRPGRNISTAEDPAEINMVGLNQVNINERAGLTFPVALRAFLRQDPDIIMVGEMRDIETADIAIKAAQTGHLVLSTLHTNDAPSTLTRLMNMGVAPFNIAASVILITAQRLLRKLCDCKQPVHLPLQTLRDAGFSEDALDGTWQTFTHTGCEKCHDSGYSGRIGIHQVMPITDAITALILAHASTIAITQQANKEGMQSLRQAGLLKVKQGLTSLEEVLAMTQA
jgi:type IV pilus assembly protein PilB